MVICCLTSGCNISEKKRTDASIQQTINDDCQNKRSDIVQQNNGKTYQANDELINVYLRRMSRLGDSALFEVWYYSEGVIYKKNYYLRKGEYLITPKATNINIKDLSDSEFYLDRVVRDTRQFPISAVLTNGLKGTEVEFFPVDIFDAEYKKLMNSRFISVDGVHEQDFIIER